eukprot:223987-Pleurochrysis_carterae.AAC.1
MQLAVMLAHTRKHAVAYRRTWQTTSKRPLPGELALVEVDVEEVDDPSQQRRRREGRTVGTRWSAMVLPLVRRNKCG